MSTREIITLQIGQYSNFIGTHWWNLQESTFIYDSKLLEEHPKEVNHDVLYREGKTLKGDVTYTPRLVLFDLKNSLGTLKKDGTLYDFGTEENINWVGDVTLHQAPSVNKNKYLKDLDEEFENYSGEDGNKVRKSEDDDTDEIERRQAHSNIKLEDPVFGKKYYNLDNDVHVWSDYIHTALHPRSIFLLKDHQHNNPETPFNIFGLGQQVSQDREQWDEIEDRVRYFTEECDQLQGFHILLDSHNAFGGLASSILSYLCDEYSNKARLSFAVTPAQPPDKNAAERSARILNSALSLSECSETSSLYIPLSLASTLWKAVGRPCKFQNLQYKAHLDYHTSSILAVSLDTTTMPYRKEKDPGRISDLTSSFSMMGRKVSALYTSLPYPIQMGHSFAESLIEHKGIQLWGSITPHVKNSANPWFQSCVVRGISPQILKSASHHHRSVSQFPSGTSVDDIFKQYFSEMYPDTQNAGFVLRDGVNVGAPFPHIFAPYVNSQGLITDTNRFSLSGVETAPIMTSLQSNTETQSYIDSLESSVSKFNITRHQHFVDAGLEPEEFAESINKLKDLAQCYKN